LGGLFGYRIYFRFTDEFVRKRRVRDERHLDE